MILPKISPVSSFFNRQKLESLILPALVVFILIGIIVAGFLIPKKNEETKQGRDTSAFTSPNKVEVQKGKIIEVAPLVKQISPDTLKASLIAKEELTIIEVFKGEDWKQPHIKGSILMDSSEFDQAPSLDQQKNYVYVSSDGYDSAEAIAKLIRYGFPYDKNLNLEGGLKAWKEKGFELEN